MAEGLDRLDYIVEKPLVVFVPRLLSVEPAGVLRALKGMESRDRPGMIEVSAVRGMFERFDRVFRRKDPAAESRKKFIDNQISLMETKTRRRSGNGAIGWIDWESNVKLFLESFDVPIGLSQRVFLTIDVSDSSSIASKVSSFLLIFAIIVSISFWIISTLPSMRKIDPNCVRDPNEVNNCPPEPFPVFVWMERICVVTFTVEYILKLVTVPAVSFELWSESYIEALLMEKWENCKKGQLDNPFVSTLKFFVQPSNVIDLLAILPFWMEVLAIAGNNSAFIILRILRLTRIFRVFKLGKYNEIFSLFGRVMVQSLPALYLMIFFVTLGLCLFGTLIWFVEQGEWYPPGNPELVNLAINGADCGPGTNDTAEDCRGAYLRNTHWWPGVRTLAETPFPSIVHSFWFVIVTVTTVGYGDAYPTTSTGKLFGALMILCGIVVLAMPVGVIGANFSNEYDKVQAERRRREKLKERSKKKRRQAEERALEPSVNEDGVEKVNQPREQGWMGESSEVDPVDLASSNEAGEFVDELKRFNKLLKQAEELETGLTKLLPADPSRRCKADLADFVQVLVSGREKAVMSDSSLILDQLTYRVFTELRAIRCDSPGAMTAMADVLAFRHSWGDFVDNCWNYWIDFPPKQQEPEDIYELKARLIRLPGVQLAG